MATGESLMAFTAQTGVPTDVTNATQDTRNNHPIIDFDAAADEAIDFAGVMPRNYGGGGITLTIVWLASTATSGDVVWNAAFERHEDDVTDLDSNSFATAQAATDTTASASGEPQYTEITFTDGAQIDSLAVGESFRLRITRDADNGSDTMAGDAELLRVEIRET